MSKTFATFAIASALLFGAVPGHAALDSNALYPNALMENALTANALMENALMENALFPNGFGPNGIDWNGIVANGQQEGASPRMTIIAVELPKAD